MVKYNGKETVIEEIYTDGSCKIVNPDWNFDVEYQCIMLGKEYDVPYWIRVYLLECN